MSLTVTVQKGHDFSSGNVTRAALNAGAVPTVAVTGSVSTTEIIDGAVTNAKLATDAVTEVKILDGAVTVDKLGADAVTLAKLSDNSVVGANILKTKDAEAANASIIGGLTAFADGVDVAADDYLMVHDTSVSVDGTVQLKRAKVSQVQKVGTTEYVMGAAISAGATATGGPVITNPTSTTPAVQVDLDGTPFQTIELDGGGGSPKTYTFSSLANQSGSSVKTVTLKVTGTGTGTATLTLPPWVWPERASGAAPTGIATGKVALLSLTSFGAGDANVIAAFAVTE